MITTTNKITLDISVDNGPVCIIAKQGDNASRFVEITLTDNGDKYTPDKTTYARFRALKPDGNSIYNSAQVNEDGTIKIELTEQTLAVKGIVEADIELRDSNNQLLSCINFLINVISAPIGKRVTSSNEFLELLELVNAVSNLYFDDSDGKISLVDYVKKTLLIAGVALSDNITAEQMQEALGTYPIMVLTEKPTPSTIGDYRQLLGVSDGSQITALYLCLGKQSDDTYKWMPIVTGSDIDLSNYVPTIRTIAGISLADDVTAEKLKTALNVSGKVIRASFLPPSNGLSTVAEVGDFWLNSKDKSLYVCYGKQATENGYANYFWLSLTDGNGGVDLSGYVPTSRKIADIDLSANITIQALQEALKTYPIIDFNDYEDYTQVGEIGQLGIEGNGSCFDLYIQLGEGYGWVPIISGDRVIERSYLVSSVDENSTDNQVPSAKLFYDNIHCARPVYDEEITESTVGKSGEVIAHFPHGNFESLYICTKVQYNSPETGVPSTYAWKKLSAECTGITETEINENGELVFTYTDGTTENLGVVVGKDGKSVTDSIIVSDDDEGNVSITWDTYENGSEVEY